MKSWKIILGLAFSVLFLVLAFRSVHRDDLAEAMRSAKYGYTVPAMLLIVASLYLRAVRWRYLLHPIKDIGRRSLFYATGVGAMVNITFPARLGEFVRAYAIGERERISRSSSFATIVVERVFDGFALLFFLAIVALFGSNHAGGWLRQAEYVAVIGYLVALATLILLKTHTRFALALAQGALRPFPRAVREKALAILVSFIDGLRVFRSTKNMGVAIALSPLVWLPNAAAIHLLLVSTGIHLGALVSLLLLVALCVGVTIPSAPGFVGNVQFVSVEILRLFGVQAGSALTFSLIYNACIFLPVLLTGIACVVAEGLSFAEIKDIMRLKR